MMIRNVFTLFLLICMTMQLSSAETTSLVLKAPADGTTTESLSMEFIFSFNNYVAIENCSLFVDGSFKALRNTMITIENNKISAILAAGEHTWNIVCYDDENNRIESEERSLKINSGEVIKTEYETIYNNNGLRSYLIQIAEGKAPVELPAMKLSEDIRIKTPLKTHYIDILRMGAEAATSFVEVRDRSNSKIHRFLVGESILLDFDNDKIIDVGLKLKNIERNANAYFTVSSYPLSEAALEEEPAEQPADEAVAENEEAQESEADIDIQPEAPVSEEQETAEAESEPSEDVNAAAEPDKNSKMTILVAAAILLLLIIIISALAIKKKSHKSSKGKKDKKAGKAKKETEPKAKPAEKEEEPDEEPSEGPINNDNADEDFEVITSVGKKRR